MLHDHLYTSPLRNAGLGNFLHCIEAAACAGWINHTCGMFIILFREDNVKILYMDMHDLCLKGALSPSSHPTDAPQKPNFALHTNIKEKDIPKLFWT